MTTYDLIVVGGGPAGMMAAGCAGTRGRRVLLLERGPRGGRKLLLTANGRCNVTNTAPVAEFTRAFGREGGFLRHALKVFGSGELLDWLHAHGVPTIEERRGRVFPASQDARSVLGALETWLREGGVEVRIGQRVRELLISNGRVSGVKIEGDAWAARHVLVATGGMSYPATGSTGDGYALARQAGHTIVEPAAALVALETVEPWPREVQGTPIKNVGIRAVVGERKLAEVCGEALWTHFGLSGPATLEISRPVVQARGRGQPVSLRLDLRTCESAAKLDARLTEAARSQGRRQLKNVLSDWIPERLAILLLKLHGLDVDRQMAQVSRDDRQRLVAMLKRLELRVSRPRPIEEAIVTAGGVALSEIDAKRMASRLLPGLFVAGEVLDLDGPSGGFNLQAAFATGHLAGLSV